MKLKKISSRSQRMQQFKKLHGKGGLNLVSLMDIFTILVFFLLVSSSNVQQIPNAKKINLPVSVAKKAPKETLLITITKQEVLLQGRLMANIDDVVHQSSPVIEKLVKELRSYSANNQLKTSLNQQKSITIMGDENISYQLLRMILATCRKADYTNIAFAAVQKAKGKV